MPRGPSSGGPPPWWWVCVNSWSRRPTNSVQPVGAFPGRPGCLSEGRGVESGPARPDAGGEPARRQVVQRQQLLGQGHRVPEVGRCHQGADPQPLGGSGRGSQGGDGGEPWPVTEALPGEVVVGVPGVEAERLGPPPHRCALGPLVDGEDHGAHSHAGTVVDHRLEVLGRAHPRGSATGLGRGRGPPIHRAGPRGRRRNLRA